MAMKRSKLPLQHSKNEATEEMLAHTLTVIRHRMQEQAQLIIAVEPPKGDGKKFLFMRSKPTMESNGGLHLPALTKS